MTANTLGSTTENVHLGELCKLGSPEGAEKLPSTAITGEMADVRSQIVNTCPWAGIDMGALPEESGK